MNVQAERAALTRAIRERICAHCDTQPPDGSSCASVGVVCGVELYLDRLIDAVREVQDRRMENFAENALDRVCRSCAARGHRVCPCPMEFLLPRAVQAVKTADQEFNPYEGVGDGCYPLPHTGPGSAADESPHRIWLTVLEWSSIKPSPPTGRGPVGGS